MQINKALLLPKEIQIEPTIRCNLNCIMCDHKARRRQADDMSFESFKRIVDQFSDLEKVHLHGIGEPLLSKHFYDMAGYLKEKGVYVCFNDNMTLIDELTAKKLILLKIDEIRISLDADNAVSYKQIRGKDMFENVLEAVKILVQTKKEMKTERPHLKIVIVALRNNLEEIPGIVTLVSELGIKEIVVQNMQSWGEEEFKNNENRKYSLFFKEQETIKVFFQIAREVASKRDVKLALPLFEDSSLTCIWPWTSCFITTEGFLTPCCNCPDPTMFNFGNLLESDLADIWNGDEYERFRERLKSDHIPEICKDCIILEGKLKDYRVLR